MQTFALSARIYVLDYLPPSPSIYRVPEENLNHEILRVLSLFLWLRKVEQLQQRQLGVVTFTPVPASPRRPPCVFVRGCLKRKGREGGKGENKGVKPRCVDVGISGDCKYLALRCLPRAQRGGTSGIYGISPYACHSSYHGGTYEDRTDGPSGEKCLTKLINYGRFKSARCGVRVFTAARERER